MSAQRKINSPLIENTSRFAAVGTFLVALFVDARFQPLAVAFVGIWVALHHWRSQGTGLITRDGDPHLFWFAMVLFASMTILALWLFAEAIIVQ